MTASTAAAFRPSIGTTIPAARALLRNWARWNLQREEGRATCASAEGNYIAPANDDDRKPRPIPPDENLAYAVETLVLVLPARTRKVLRVWYVDSIRYCPREFDGHRAVWCARHAYVGSARRFMELLQDAETAVADLWHDGRN